MTVKITFEELSKYISSNFNKTFAFAQKSEKEIRVTFSQKVLFTTANVNIDITFDQALGSAVTLTYNGGFGVDMIICGALTFVKNKLPELAQAIDDEGNHKIRIHLDKIKQTKSLAAAVSLRSISAEADGLVACADLK